MTQQEIDNTHEASCTIDDNGVCNCKDLSSDGSYKAYQAGYAYACGYFD